MRHSATYSHAAAQPPRHYYFGAGSPRRPNKPENEEGEKTPRVPPQPGTPPGSPGQNPIEIPGRPDHPQTQTPVM